MANMKPIIVALDFAHATEALNFVQQIDPTQCRVKVGKELFTSAGPDFVRALVKLGFDVFLDLKFHDIPNTVAQAIKASARLGVWMVNVHASGGMVMMRAAREALEEFGDRAPLLTAVTVLTSMSETELQATGVARSLNEQVIALAKDAENAGLDGIVCSARELKFLKEVLKPNFVYVTPGIRPADSALQDQTRVMTPIEAMQAGATYLVIGRPIRQSKDPSLVLSVINEQINQL